MKVYLVVFDWKTEGEQGVDVYAFHTYKDAAKMFNEIIETEKTHDLSWAANAFDEECYFCVTRTITNGLKKGIWVIRYVAQ